MVEFQDWTSEKTAAQRNRAADHSAATAVELAVAKTAAEVQAELKAAAADRTEEALELELTQATLCIMRRAGVLGAVNSAPVSCLCVQICSRVHLPLTHNAIASVGR